MSVNLTVGASTFIGNVASGGQALAPGFGNFAYGGAVSFNIQDGLSGALSFSNSTFTSNQAIGEGATDGELGPGFGGPGSGGAIFAGSALTVTSCTFIGNQALFEPTLKQMESIFGPAHRDTLGCRRNLAIALLASGKIAEALAIQKANVKLSDSSLSPQHPESLSSRQALADAFLAAARFTSAESLMRESLPWATKTFGQEDLRTARMTATLGTALLKQQRWADAQVALKQCLDLREKIEPDDWSTFDTRSLLGDCLLGQARFAEAEPLIFGGYEGMKAREAKIPVFSKQRLGDAAERILRLFKAWGKPEKAAEWSRKIAHASEAQIDLPADVFTPRRAAQGSMRPQWVTWHGHRFLRSLAPRKDFVGHR